jgi:hypothetical protein
MSDKRALIAKGKGDVIAKSAGDHFDLPRALVEAALRGPADRPVRGKPRIILMIDATASREPSWETAKVTQAAMFREAAAKDLSMQLVCFGGGFDKKRRCRFSRWIDSADAMAKLMSKVQCQAGYTQICRGLERALEQAKQAPVQAVVVIGDAFETRRDDDGGEEDVGKVSYLALQLRHAGCKIIAFHEGHDPASERIFRLMAEMSGGAFFHFESGAEKHLAELFGAVAAFAAGGRKALAQKGGAGATLLLPQLGS